MDTLLYKNIVKSAWITCPRWRKFPSTTATQSVIPVKIHRPDVALFPILRVLIRTKSCPTSKSCALSLILTTLVFVSRASTGLAFSRRFVNSKLWRFDRISFALQAWHPACFIMVAQGMSARDEDISKMLKCNTHLGTKNCDVLMEPYVFKRRYDGEFSASVSIQ